MPVPTPPSAMAYVSTDLDRRAHERDKPDIVAARRAEPGARAVLFAREQPVLARDGGALHAVAEIGALGGALNEAYLGVTPAGEPRFAAWLHDGATELRADSSDGFLDRRELVIPGRDDLAMSDLRSLALKGAFDPATLSALSLAKALLSWHARHGFCPNCGAPTVLGSAGWRRDCPACKTQHFPRTDPVVIMLVSDGDHCLLGRQPRFPKGMYSALAGFLEPGETIADAVKREVFEEAGLRCGDVSVFASQPWPFPASLMIGCMANAVTRDIVVDGEELEDARWFSRAEARAMLAGAHPEGLMAPNPMAIANALLTEWVEG